MDLIKVDKSHYRAVTGRGWITYENGMQYSSPNIVTHSRNLGLKNPMSYIAPRRGRRFVESGDISVLHFLSENVFTHVRSRTFLFDCNMDNTNFIINSDTF